VQTVLELRVLVLQMAFEPRSSWEVPLDMPQQPMAVLPATRLLEALLLVTLVLETVLLVTQAPKKVWWVTRVKGAAVVVLGMSLRTPRLHMPRKTQAANREVATFVGIKVAVKVIM
jgi:hypothetical protein